jgi:hypothetical protein
MILGLFLLFSPQGSEADQVLARFANAHKTPPAYEAKMRADEYGTVTETEFKMDRMKRGTFIAHFPEGRYLLAVNEQGMREIDESQRMYADYPYYGGFKIPKSLMTHAAKMLPMFLFNGDLRNLVPSGSRFETAGTHVTNGFSGDRIFTTYKDDQGQPVRVDFDVDRAGKLVRFSSVTTTRRGDFTEVWEMVDYKPRTSFEDREFVLDTPLGYTPFALPHTYRSVEVGEKWPVDGWTNSQTGSSARLAEFTGGRKSLVALLGAECESSNRARSSLTALQASMPVVIVSDQRTQQMAGGSQLFDARGENLKFIMAPATPFFALVNESGEIIKLWMGYDQERAKAFENEVLEMARG